MQLLTVSLQGSMGFTIFHSKCLSMPVVHASPRPEQKIICTLNLQLTHENCPCWMLTITMPFAVLSRTNSILLIGRCSYRLPNGGGNNFARPDFSQCVCMTWTLPQDSSAFLTLPFLDKILHRIDLRVMLQRCKASAAISCTVQRQTHSLVPVSFQDAGNIVLSAQFRS